MNCFWFCKTFLWSVWVSRLHLMIIYVNHRLDRRSFCWRRRFFRNLALKASKMNVELFMNTGNTVVSFLIVLKIVPAEFRADLIKRTKCFCSIFKIYKLRFNFITKKIILNIFIFYTKAVFLYQKVLMNICFIKLRAKWSSAIEECKYLRVQTAAWEQRRWIKKIIVATLTSLACS